MALDSIRAALEFGVLGPLAVHHEGRVVLLAGAKERGVLAFLLLRANQVVPAERLIDSLWPDDPPATARNSLQVRISHLRKVLGAGRIETLRNGYRLNVSPDQLDVLRFRRLMTDASRARGAGDALTAAANLAQALGLWRGEVLPEFSDNPLFRVEIGALEEERLTAFETRIDAELELGRAAEVVPELQAAVVDNPLRERLMGQLMLALYQTGRQADALDAYAGARRQLVEQLGLDPSPLLADLHQRILAQDPQLSPPRAVPTRSSAAPSRRNLTVALVLLGMPTRVDLEVAARKLADARATVCACLEHHGGITSNLADGVVATFGLPVTRENGPGHAVELALALAAENDVKIALDFGVVLATDDELIDDRFVAELRALAATAHAGDVVVGAGAREVLGEAVSLRGSVVVSFDRRAETVRRNLDAPLIGRDREFKRLRESFEWSVANSGSHLVTIVGPPGIGKSRLARELVMTVSREAVVLTGRCLAYGGDALGPLAEMVNQAAGETTPEALLDLLSGLEDRRSVVDQLAAALGTATRTRAEDASWAFRKLFGALASDRPLVLVFDDLQWADGRLLDFIEELVDRPGDAPILVVCLARPDLLEQQPSWGGGNLDAESIQLVPLSEGSSDELIRLLADSMSADARVRIAARAEGNPLFIEQLVALAEDSPNADPDAIPASIHAVLSARVDRLPAAERTLLECASIVGLEFSLADIAALLRDPAPDELAAIARRLIRKDLLRSVDHDARRRNYRFRHILIRDAIYGSVLKSTRAELHERFARSLEPLFEEGARELEEIIGYHLESSYNFREELEPGADGLEHLGNEAGARLTAAGRRQLDRSNVQAAIQLLERGQRLLVSPSHHRADVLADIASAYQLVGNWTQSREYLDEALALVGDDADTALGAWLRGLELQLELHAGELPTQEFISRASTLLSSLETQPSVYAARLKSTLAWAHALAGHYQLSESLIDAVVGSKLHPGDPRKLLPSLWLDGPLAVPEAIRRCKALLAFTPPPRTSASCYRTLAQLHSMQGEFARAHDLCAMNEEILDELGLRPMRAASRGISATVHALAGQTAEAEHELRVGMSELRELGEALFSTGLESQLARLLLDEDDAEEAGRVLGSQDVGPSEDIAYQLDLMGVRARLLVADGSHEPAVALAVNAVILSDHTDSPLFQGYARVDFGRVLREMGQVERAKIAFGEAALLFEQKGDLVDARETEALLNT